MLAKYECAKLYGKLRATQRAEELAKLQQELSEKEKPGAEKAANEEELQELRDRIEELNASKLDDGPEWTTMSAYDAFREIEENLTRSNKTLKDFADAANGNGAQAGRQEQLLAYLYSDWTDEEMQKAVEKGRQMYDQFLERQAHLKQQAEAVEAEHKRQDAQPRITAEQIASLRDRIQRMKKEKGIDLEEFLDAGGQGRYTGELEDKELYFAELQPFEILYAAIGTPKEQEVLKTLSGVYYDEAVKALDYLENLAASAKQDVNRYNYADMGTKRLADWFNSHDYSNVLQNYILGIEKVEKKEKQDGTSYTVFSLAKDLPGEKFDPDKVEDFDPQILERAKTLYQENEDLFSSALDNMHIITHETYGAVLGGALQRLQPIDDFAQGYEGALAKLNEFRHLMFEIYKQDQRVCKLGTDLEPVYVEPLYPDPDTGKVDFAAAKFCHTESEILKTCHKMLKDGAEGVSWNSNEYNDIMRAVQELDTKLQTLSGGDQNPEQEYIDAISDILNKCSLYFQHKADDGIKNDGTMDKIVAVERISKMLKERYRTVTGEEYTDPIAAKAELFDQDEMIQPVDETLRGKAYVQDVGLKKIASIKAHSLSKKELKDLTKKRPSLAAGNGGQKVIIEEPRMSK
ncbi:MAG: hypothetical protein IKS07_05710, partial [Lachnospiraceae bacterium]|nr:hypothetical protein [Lachnospiraceae bacterium]